MPDSSRVPGTYFLGPYRVVKEIGVGGMASVELARMDGAGGFRKWVAIKRIHPHLTEDRQLVKMFLEEARIAARISHPNVAQVFNVGHDAGIYWLAMEYLHGESLRDVIVAAQSRWHKPVDPCLAATIIADAATGLHAAHTLRDKHGRPLNLVHRDISPQNLFVTYDGATKVVDFGIAKVAGGLSSTQAGTFKGKVAYVAPEQALGKPVDRRADIFSLGVVLWEMTTGRRLFRMESDIETLRRVQQCVVVPPSAIVEDYPSDLEQIVLHALKQRPDDRFQTALELSRALRNFVVSQGALVGSDEVSSYVGKLFQQRMRERERQLRWAEEVTQTISLQEHLSRNEPEEQFVDLLALSPDNDGDEQSSRHASGHFPSHSDIISSVQSPRNRDGLAPIRATSRSGAEKTTARPIAGDDDTSRLPDFAEDDDLDDDDAATLIADSPAAMRQQSRYLSRGEDSPPAATESNNLELPTRVERPSTRQPIPSHLPDAPLPYVPAPPPPTAIVVDTAQRPSHGRANPIIAIAAALGAGFIAAGIGAIVWVQRHAPPTPVRATASSYITSDAASSPHATDSTSATPIAPVPQSSSVPSKTIR